MKFLLLNGFAYAHDYGFLSINQLIKASGNKLRVRHFLLLTAAALQPDRRNVQRIGYMYFPRPSEKSIPAAAFWANDTRCNRSRFPSEHRVRKSSCIFLDYFLFCIPRIHLERM